MLEPYKQILPDTCLPSCLGMYLEYLGKSQNLNLEFETDVLIKGGKIGRVNRTFGHLCYVCREFNLEGLYVTNDKDMHAGALEIESKYSGVDIKSVKGNITIRYISDLLDKAPVILGVDNYYFNKDFHFPHFVFIEKQEGKEFVLIEPWQGVRMRVDSALLEKAMEGLDHEILYWRELIQLHEQ